MTSTTLNTNVTESIVLKKFEGDGPKDRTDEPIEIIEILDGKIVSHIKDGQRIK